MTQYRVAFVPILTPRPVDLEVAENTLGEVLTEAGADMDDVETSIHVHQNGAMFLCGTAAAKE